MPERFAYFVRTTATARVLEQWRVVADRLIGPDELRVVLAGGQLPGVDLECDEQAIDELNQRDREIVEMADEVTVLDERGNVTGYRRIREEAG